MRACVLVCACEREGEGVSVSVCVSVCARNDQLLIEQPM